MAIPVSIVRILNPLVAAILRSPFHGLLSANTMLLTFPGRKTGRLYTTPVSYVRDGSRVRCFTENPWVRNFREEVGVTLRLAGEDLAGRARGVAGDPDRIAPALADFLRRVPRDATYAGVRLRADGTPEPEDVRSAAREMTLIEVEISSSRSNQGPGRA